ncbi:MAG TPA: glyoxalase, partial [Betaproteobacteria bacterium]|nr:glyoxalase [Betaproteobacteria bacterium]
ADLARARAFYEGALELTASPQRPPMTFDGVWYDLGACQIHLMCLPNPEAGLQRPIHPGRDRHLALAVSDLDRLKTRLDSAGIACALSLSGRRALFCRDPDDNALEFVEAT